MKIYSVTEAKAKFSQVIESVLQGEEVIVTKMGKPAVKISSYEPIADNKRLGLMKGKATIPDDFGEWTDEEAKLFRSIEC
ncbi:MAG: type II toxin-antitoxin system Phd/YefM family antitoxin [Xenococcaceae cyanobacterium]